MAGDGYGFIVIASEAEVPVPHVLVPATLKSPDCALSSKLTWIVLVVLLPLAPCGNVQIY